MLLILKKEKRKNNCKYGGKTGAENKAGGEVLTQKPKQDSTSCSWFCGI